MLEVLSEEEEKEESLYNDDQIHKHINNNEVQSKNKQIKFV